jgi:anti-sigma factor RsiW
MADILCGYTADRDETLVAYLYGDIEPPQRAAFDAHIVTCERCRHELEDLQQLRGELQCWTAPEVLRPLASPMPAPALLAPSSRAPGSGLLRDVPAWAQVAAALLVLGVSAGVGGAIANLDVRYEQGTVTIRTGWSRAEARGTVPASRSPQSGTVRTASGASAPWQADLEALERRLRAEVQGSISAAPATAVAHTEGTATVADAPVLRKVRALLEESERRQRNELALRIAEVVQEFDTKRGTDLANIRSMKTIQSATGLEVVRQQQWLNLLTQSSVQCR